MRTFFERVGAFGVAALALGAGFLGYQYYTMRQEIADLQTTLAIATTTAAFTEGELTQKLSAAEQLNNDLQMLLQARSKDLNTYNDQIASLQNTLGELDKLSKTDRELLEKYSSVYFLNENYVPASLSPIPTDYLNRPDKPEEIHSQILPHLTALLDAAKASGVDLQVLSAYRSYGMQGALKSQYKVTYGAGTANSFSADQGYSEHQLGSTVDFTTPKLGGNLTGFEKTTALPWLMAHAYEYGFALSYPKGNTHFVYEPWHWRYVGLELAKRLHDENKTLYDLDQRDINTYLVKIFD